MPQPPHIEPALLSQWNEDFDKLWTTQMLDSHPILQLMDDRDRRRLSFIAGCWLKKELLTTGLQNQQTEKICFAFGQICSAAWNREVWDIAREILDQSRTGQPPEPGEPLASSLISQYGFPPKLIHAIRTLGPGQCREILRDNPLPEIKIP